MQSIRARSVEARRLSRLLPSGLVLALALAWGGAPPAAAHPLMAEKVDYPFVAGFDRFHQPEDDEADVIEGGILLLSELNCVACHAAPQRWAASLPGRAKLSLEGVGSRLSEDDLWLFVRSPQHRKKGTTMPGFFAGPYRSDRALEAVTQYLASLKTELPKFPEGDVERGRQLYHGVGCVACHEPAKPEDYHPPEAPPNVAVERPGMPSVPILLADRYNRDALAAFLMDPLAIRRDGRMPAAALTPQEAADLAAYLHLNREPLQVEERAILRIKPPRPEEGRWAFGAMRCNACHDAKGAPDTAPPLPPLMDLNASQGCLSVKKIAGVPDYGLSDFQRRALTLALQKIRTPAKPATALEQAHDAFTRMNCYACHEWRGTGGLEDPRAQYFTTLDPTAHSLGELGRLPPKLDNVGRKLTPAWFAKLFWEGDGAVRPYMTARMPRFGQGNTESLIPLLETVSQREKTIHIDTSGLLKHQRAESGRVLMGVGTGGLGCVACHGLKDRRPLGVAVINLSQTVKRLRPEYFKELLLDPQTTQPGTLMPPLFMGRKKAGEEIEEIWTYLKELDQNRLPDGLIQTGDYELKPEKVGHPIVFRTFLQGAGMQAVAVGFPQGWNVAFDSLEVRWALSWRGRFLDAMTTWEERAMTPAKPLGEEVKRLPAHMPLAKKKSAGDPWPETWGEPAGYVFKGYRLSKDGAPIFLYEAEGVQVEDEVRATPDGKALQRTLTAHGGGDDWYFWGEGPNAQPEPIHWVDGKAVLQERW